MSFTNLSGNHSCELLNIAYQDFFNPAPRNDLLPDNLEAGFRNNKQNQSTNPSGKFTDISDRLVIG
jgi:hypothetical protein